MARKKKTKEPVEEPEKLNLDVDAEDPDAEPEAEAAPPAKPGLVARIVPVAIVTVLAAAAGIGAGYFQAGMVESATIARVNATPPAKTTPSVKYSGDLVLQEIEPIVTNLAAPADVWIRIETAMVFKNGTLENPKVVAAEIRSDMVAYARTLELAQLEGPSALQHLSEDLNERVATRTEGRVTELIIQTLVVQ